MAEDVTVVERPAAAEPRVSKRERARRASYRYRFGIAYVLLAIVVGAGVGAFVVLARSSPPEAEAWSAWQPTGSRTAMLRQIADRIPKAYTENGKQLTITTTKPLAVPTELGIIPVDWVFVRHDTSRGLAEEDDIDRHEGGDVVAFGICGLARGNTCMIPSGERLNERVNLLRRQALELSLYTLKYVDDVGSVLVFMPPNAKGETIGTIFLTREDVADELRRPLAETLPSRTPKLGSLRAIEEGHVLRLTQTRTFGYQTELSPDGSMFLVLSPPSAAPPS